MTTSSYEIKSSSDLRLISLNSLPPFALNIGGNKSKNHNLRCQKILRCLPGKRLSCVGNWQGEPVFAKLFIDPNRANIHWQRDMQGIRTLMEQKILTPPLLHSGELPDGGGFFCLYEYFPDGKNLKELWNTRDADNRISLLHQSTELLARHHSSGIIQQDVHLNNFLVVSNAIYTLDGAQINVQQRPLDLTSSINNLAMFFAQFFPENDENITDALQIYVDARGWKISPEIFKTVLRVTARKRKKREVEFLKKTKRECTAFVYHRNWYRLSVCDRQYYSDSLRELIADPDCSITQGTVIKKGYTSTVASTMIDGQCVLVKRYNIKNWKHAISRAFRPTRAFHTWTNAHRLIFFGINTPTPIAFIEERWGFIRRRAYYISEYYTGDTCWDFFHNPKIKQKQKLQIAKSIAAQLKKLKNIKISHGDLKASNILVSGNQASFVDLDSMKRHWFSRGFKKAWEKDMKRFLRNWSECESVTAMFKNYLDLSKNS